MTTSAAPRRTSAYRRSLLGIGSAITVLHIAGWGLLFSVLLPLQSAASGNPGVLLGLAAGAYALGLRHAFDADHIAAIDNATRQLVARGQESVATGFWFALGHSSVVLGSVFILALGADAFAVALSEEGSPLRFAAGIWGGTVSGLFLIAAGLTNVPALRRLSRLHRHPTVPASELHAALERRGVLYRLFRPFTRLVSRASRMYLVGLLFGLGLDTAASIGLFVLADALAPGLSSYAVLVLPLLFTAGMTLFDTVDAVLARSVYRWGADGDSRAVTYNLVVTSVSVLIALLVGGIGLSSVVDELVGSSLLQPIASIDLSGVGIAAVALLLLAWLVAAIVRRRSMAGLLTFRQRPHPRARFPAREGTTVSESGQRAAPRTSRSRRPRR